MENTAIKGNQDEQPDNLREHHDSREGNSSKCVRSGNTLNELAGICHSIAKEKGFWDKERNIGEALMLIVTELAEAMEAYRKEDKANFDEELADTFIRLLDLCGGLGIDIEDAISKKCEKNKTRPYKHGKIC